MYFSFTHSVSTVAGLYVTACRMRSEFRGKFRTNNNTSLLSRCVAFANLSLFEIECTRVRMLLVMSNVLTVRYVLGRAELFFWNPVELE